MYRYNCFRSEDWFWIRTEEEIRALSADVDKAINIVLGTYDRWSSCSVWPIVVGGGCHERDTGYETFSGGEYPWREGWVEYLLKDFKEEEADLDGGWFCYLNFDEMIVNIMGYYGPIVLQFYRGEMIVTVSYDDDHKEKEQELLEKFEEAFGKAER